MNVLRIFTVLIFLSLASGAQNAVVKSTDKYTALINQELKESLLEKKQSGGTSVLGGTLTAYYLHKKLVLITTHSGDGFGYIDYFFYFKDDSLVFAKEKKIFLKEPATEKEYADYEKYVLFNTDKNGNTDLTKWSLTVNINNDFYFNKNQVIKYQLWSFDKPVKPLEYEIGEITKDLVYRYTTHLEEIK